MLDNAVSRRREHLEKNPGAAAYGAIVVTAATAATSLHDTRAWVSLAEAASTLGVFFVAHAHSELLSRRFADHDESVASAVRASLAHTWPMLEAALLPLAVLSAAALHVIGGAIAIWTALWIGVAELFVLGYRLGRRRRDPLLRALGVGALYAAIGAALVALKVAIH